MLVVRDFSTEATKWVYWKASTLAEAYNEYPTLSSFPPISSLLGKIQVIKSLDSGSGSSYSPPKDSLWTKVEDNMYPCDTLSGRRGEWDIYTADSNMKSFFGVSTDGVSVLLTADAIYSLAQDENGNIISEPTSEGSVIAVIDGDNVIFKTSYEYDYGSADSYITSGDLATDSIDVVPGDMSLPDRFWIRVNTDIIPR
jgi:hypothetical protein